MKRKLYILIFAVSMLSFVGCSKDFLENSPTNAISAADALSSPDNMMLVLNGLHRQMYSQFQLSGGTYSRSGQSFFLPAFDAIGGSLIHTSRGNGWHRSEAQWRTHTNETYTTVRLMWYHRYHFIASANSIINKVEEDQLTIDADMKNILGQAHAYRAWAYHQLVSTYAKGYLISADPASEPGVPLLFATEAPYTSAARSSVKDIYDQCMLDIDQAIEYLKTASAPNNHSHISLNAAYGIKARIALNKGDWAAAATAAALAREGYPLMGETEYKSGFNDYDLSEVIWGGKVIDSETNYYVAYFYFVGTNFNGTQTRTNPKMLNNAIYNMIPETDYRKDLWLPKAPNTYSSSSDGLGGDYTKDPNYDTYDDWIAARNAIRSEYGMGSHQLHPYMSVKFLSKHPNTIDPDDVIYMRSSEMVLIEAEAKAMLNDIAGAQNALAILGEARDSAFDKTAFTTKEALMAQIKFQRRVELYGEGFSYHDQIRWDEGFDKAANGSGAAAVLYGDGMAQAKPSINNAWIWKIPQAEIDANPNLSAADQN